MESTFVSMESLNYPRHYIRHDNFLGKIAKVENEGDKICATFKKVQGLATGDPNAGAYSFESVNYPGYYLRHQNSKIKLAKYEDTDLFKQDATFYQRPGLADNSGYSLEAYNYPRHYIRHYGYQLSIAKDDGSFRPEATFIFVEPLAYPILNPC